MLLPFFNRYPHTNFEQLNIDWLLTTVSGFDARIKKNEEDINTLDGRVDTLEGRVDNHDIDISDLKERVSGAESDINIINNKVNNMEITVGAHDIDISDLKQRMSTAEGTITAQGLMIGDIQHTITDLMNKDLKIEDMIAEQYDDTTSYEVGDYAIYNDILYRCVVDTSGSFDSIKWTQVNVTNELNLRKNQIENQIENLTEIVNDIPVVEANPGGTGTTLNTITIDDITYVIPSGGGGSGSTVTPNPSGTPTDDLISVDIDGTIYAIPSDVEANPSGTSTGDLTKIRIASDIYDIPQLTVDDTLDSSSSNPIANSAVTSAINNVNSDFIYDRSINNVSVPNDASRHSIKQITLDPGLWLIRASSFVNMHGSGNEEGVLGIMIAHGTNSYGADDYLDSTNYFHVNENLASNTHSVTAKTDTIVELTETTTIHILGYVALGSLPSTDTRTFTRPVTTVLKLK